MDGVVVMAATSSTGVDEMDVQQSRKDFPLRRRTWTSGAMHHDDGARDPQTSPRALEALTARYMGRTPQQVRFCVPACEELQRAQGRPRIAKAVFHLDIGTFQPVTAYQEGVFRVDGGEGRYEEKSGTLDVRVCDRSCWRTRQSSWSC